MNCPRHFSVGDQTWVQFGSKYKSLHAFYCATLLFRNRVQINFARDFRCGVPQQCLHSSYWSTYAIKYRRVAASEDAERPAAKSVVFPDFVRPDSPTRCFARGQIDRRVVRNRQRQLQRRLARTSALNVASRRKRPTASISALEAPCVQSVVTSFDGASSERLETWRVVPCFCVDAEGRKPLGGAQLDFDLAPSRVV